MIERRQARLLVIDDDPAVRSISPEAPVILVTGSASEIDMERAGALGLTVLHKPIPLQELRTAVRQALDGSRASDH